MKKFSPLWIVLPMLPFAALAQQKNFVINGQLNGVKDKSLVYLTDANNPKDTLAKSKVAGGKFVLNGKVPEPGLYNLNITDVQKKGLLFLDNSTVSISGDAGDIQKMNVTGSPSNKDFEEFQAYFNPLFQKITDLSKTANMTGVTDSLKAQANQTTTQIQDGITKFIAGRKSSYVSPFLLLVTAQLSDNTALLESRYTGLADNVKQSYYGKYLKQMIAESKVGAVGSPAIDFTQANTEGKPVSLSSFRGKYVLVDFWASWCGPCRQENPNVVNNYKAYKDKNFTVLGVSLDKSKDSWLKAIKDDNLTWTHVSDLKYWNNEVAQKYKVQSIPQNYLIDPTGKIVGRNLRGPELTQRLAELLK